MAVVDEPAIWPMVYDGLDTVSRAKIIFRPFWYNQLTSGNGTSAYRPFKEFYPEKTARHLETVNVLYGDGQVKAQNLMNFFQQVCPTTTPATTYSSTDKTKKCDGAPSPRWPKG